LKTLKQFLQKIKENIIFCYGNENFVPQKITSSSESCIENSLFVAIRGEKNDGHDFILDAIKRGAKVIIFEKDISDEIIQKIPVFYAKVSNSRLVHSLLLEEFYDNPAQKLKLIGVTGTNGKTTTTYILHKLISAKYNCGMISTVEYLMPSFREDASRTTPSPEKFQQLLNMMAMKKCNYAVMELSSHGIHQQRTGSAKFAAAVFTNLSGEHLDYHKTMENYYKAKKILFEKLLENDAYAVINSDNNYGKRLLSELNHKNLISCGFEGNPDFKITNIKYTKNGMQFKLNGKEIFKISSNLFGKYNAMNISQAFIVALKLGLNPKDILLSLQKGIEVPGRLQKFYLKNGAIAFVDYAHTDDALENVLKTLNEIKRTRIICVFGCGGDRDKTKRPRMGTVAEKLSDIQIITSDNPRSEKPDEIIKEISKGVKNLNNLICIENRKDAIKYGVEISKKNDIILIAGKGHEKGQEINGVVFPHDDCAEIKKYSI